MSKIPTSIDYEDTLGNQHTYTMGQNCVSIEEHKAQGDGDKWYYDITVKDREFDVVREFRPIRVFFKIYSGGSR